MSFRLEWRQAQELQRGQRNLLRELDQAASGRLGHDDRVEAAIANYELAFRMQAAVPELLNIHGESAATRRHLFSRFADTPTLVIGGHFNAGHIKREGDAFKFIALG